MDRHVAVPRRRWSPGRLVLLACALGAVTRLWPAVAHPFPVETGGLFYVFIKDILAAGWALPQQTTYNGGLPFAYPPLSFYVAALVSVVSGADPLAVLRWLPSSLAALTVPAVWLLARRLLTPWAAAWAALAFALIPINLLMIEGGGGLPRVLGLLLAVLGLEAAVAARGSFKNAPRAGVLLAGAIACHPEIALFTVSSAALLFLSGPRSAAWTWRGTAGLDCRDAAGWLWRDAARWLWRSSGWVWRGAAVAAIVAGLTALWAVPDLLRHGLGTYLGASAQPVPYSFIGGPEHWFSLHSLTGEAGVPVVQIAALLGALVAVRQRRYWMPLWVLGIILLDERAPTLVLPVPVALLAGCALGERGASLLREIAIQLKVRPSLLVAPLLATSAAWMCLAAALAPSSMSSDDLATMDWAATQTNPASTFLVIPGNRLFVSEWFPALTTRRSVATHEGTEWLGAATFIRTVQEFDTVQSCRDADVRCIEDWSAATSHAFNYVLVATDTPLAVDLATARGYELVYATSESAVFKRLV